MADNNRTIQARASFTGAMDHDTDDRYIKEGDYILLENGTIASDIDGGRFSAKNIVSSKLITDLSADPRKTLGAKGYKGKLYVFYYLYESEATEFVEIDPIAESTEVLFSKDIYTLDDSVNDIDIVENHITGDLLCYWIGSDLSPFKVNITFLKNGGVYDTVEDMYSIRKPPQELDISPYKDYSFSGYSTKNKNFQFTHRFVYQDGEKTPLAPYSRSSYSPDTSIPGSATLTGTAYYVNGGKLYRIIDFDLNSKTEMSSGYSEDYSLVMPNEDGSVLIMASETSDIPVLVSYDRGSTFEESDLSHDVNSIAMSKDGSYVYLLATDAHIYKSSDAGKTYTIPYSNTWLTGQIQCTSDGSMIVFTTTKESTDSSGNLEYESTALVRYDYGEEFLDQKKAFSQTGIPPVAAGISETGKNIALMAGSLHNVSGDYGDNFTSYTGRPEVKSVVVFDNGIGFADGIKTTDNFATTSSFDAMDRVYKLPEAFIGVNESSGLHTLYDITGSSQAQLTSSSYKLGFLQETTSRELLQNIRNFYNAVDIAIPPVNKYVDSVEVFAVDVNTGSVYLIKELSASNIDPVDGTTVTFKNNLIYRLLSKTEQSALFSNVPKRAEHQAFIGNRLFYLNYVDGFNVGDVDFSVEEERSELWAINLEYATYDHYISVVLSDTIFGYRGGIKQGDTMTIPFFYLDNNGYRHPFTWKHKALESHMFASSYVDELRLAWQSAFPGESVTTVSVTSGELVRFFVDGTFIQAGQPTLQGDGLTYKEGHAIEVGIVYMDEYNRTPGPVFSNGEIVIGENIDTPIVKLRVTINSIPPSWATQYKFVRTDRDLSYRLMSGFQYAKAEKGRVYLMKYAEDLYAPDAGMTLEVHGDSGEMHSFPVEQVVTKEADFVSGAPAGEWVVIFEPEVIGFTGDDINKGTSLYYDATFYVKSNLEVADNMLYYEIPGTFSVMNGYHIGNIVNQLATDSAVHIIENDGNSFYLPEINIKTISVGQNIDFYNGGRPHIVPEEHGEINRYASITWSDPFVQESGANGLSMFNLATGNYKNLDVAFGPVNAVISRDTNLLIWQEDRVGYLLVNKNAITTSMGEQAIVKQEEVAGEFVSATGLWGTRHPRTIDISGGVVYFADQKRNAICRLSQNGITPISNYKISSTLRKALQSGDELHGVYDPKNNEYWFIDVTDTTAWVFDEAANGWTRTLTPFQANHTINEDNVLYSFVGGTIYAEMQGTDYGTLHGDPAPFKAIAALKGDGAINMLFDAIQLESNRALATQIYVPSLHLNEFGYTPANIPVKAFDYVEGEYFASVPLIGSSGSPSGGSIIPLGECYSSAGDSIELKTDLDIIIGTINHEVYYLDTAGVPALAGDLIQINKEENSIRMNPIRVFDQYYFADRFVFLKEKSYINGTKLRAPSVRVEVEDSVSDSKLYLFSIQLKESLSESYG